MAAAVYNVIETGLYIYVRFTGFSTGRHEISVDFFGTMRKSSVWYCLNIQF